MLIGYARVSTDEQNLELQLDALKKAGAEKVYEEKVSGTRTSRPELDACLKSLRKGDTLVVWRLDRLGRSLQHLVETITELENEGVAFKSVSDSIDTSSASGKLMFHIFASLAEFERSLISERTKAGLESARKRGRVGGRRPKLNASQREAVRKMMKDPATSVSKVAKDFGVSRATLYNIANKGA